MFFTDGEARNTRREGSKGERTDYTIHTAGQVKLGARKNGETDFQLNVRMNLFELD